MTRAVGEEEGCVYVCVCVGADRTRQASLHVLCLDFCNNLTVVKARK